MPAILATGFSDEATLLQAFAWHSQFCPQDDRLSELLGSGGGQVFLKSVHTERELAESRIGRKALAPAEGVGSGDCGDGKSPRKSGRKRKQRCTTPTDRKDEFLAMLAHEFATPWRRSATLSKCSNWSRRRRNYSIRPAK